MLKKLRHSLTNLAATLTGAVLLVMAFSALNVAEGQLENSNRAVFNSNLNSVVAKIQTDRIISHTWLSQIEADEGLILSIRDGGVPLSFPGAWTPKTDRSILIERAQTAGFSYGVDVSLPPFSVIETVSASFTVAGDHGERYLAGAAVVPAHGAWQSFLLLRDMTDADAQVRYLRAVFAVLVILGVAALYALCWLFSGRAIRPIEESQRRQSEFIAAASHELRSPLTVIHTSAEALTVDSTKAPRLIENIQSECRRMTRLVDDLLTLARSDSGTWAIRFEAVDMDTLLLETAELFYPLARQRGQTFTLEVPDTNLPTVFGDGERLRQVLTVLLDNAFSYTPEDGVVTLGGAVSGKWLLITVRDTGPGVPPEHQKHIFDRFYRADPSRTGKEHFGLGLSIAAELAHLHHGTLRLAETGSGGTAFELKLPIER